MVELPVAMKETLAQPTNSMAAYATPMAGAAAQAMMASPKPVPAMIIERSPVRPRAAVNSPPTTAPMPIAAVRKP